MPTILDQAWIKLACDMSSAFAGLSYFIRRARKKQRRPSSSEEDQANPTMKAIKVLARPAAYTSAESAVRNALYLWLVSRIISLGETHGTAGGFLQHHPLGSRHGTCPSLRSLDAGIRVPQLGLMARSRGSRYLEAKSFEKGFARRSAPIVHFLRPNSSWSRSRSAFVSRLVAWCLSLTTFLHPPMWRTSPGRCGGILTGAISSMHSLRSLALSCWLRIRDGIFTRRIHRTFSGCCRRQSCLRP